MSNNIPSEYFPVPSETERDIELRQPEWGVTVSNWRELGEAIASYNVAIENFDFFGTAIMQRDGDHITLEILLQHEINPRCDWEIKCGREGCPNCHGTPF